MIWLYLLAVAILGAVVVLLIGRAEGAPPPDADAGGDDVTRLLTERAKSPLTAGDLREVELTTALRGYRMDEVDQLLEALAEQLDRKDPSSRVSDQGIHDLRE